MNVAAAGAALHMDVIPRSKGEIVSDGKFTMIGSSGIASWAGENK